MLAKLVTKMIVSLIEFVWIFEIAIGGENLVSLIKVFLVRATFGIVRATVTSGVAGRMVEAAVQGVRDIVQVVRAQTASQAIPSRFEDGNIVEWLDTFEVCAVANQWDDAARLRRLPTFLGGRAFAVFRRLGDGRRDTIAHLRQAVIETFLPAEERGARYQEFDTCSMNASESVDKFVYRLEQLLAMAIAALDGEGPEAILKQHFIKGMEPDVRRRLYENPVLTYAQSITTAKQLISASKQVADDTKLGGLVGKPGGEDVKVKQEPAATANYMRRGYQQSIMSNPQSRTPWNRNRVGNNGNAAPRWNGPTCYAC